MGKSIAVMNTKGGVGKSTIVMAIAETLSVYHGKNVLVVDSDSQTSISTMLIDMARWEQLERDQATLVHYLEAIVLDETPTDWKPFVATGASDVDDAESVYLLPSHMQLSLFEREVSATKREPLLREAVRAFLADASRYFDLIIVDCPPGLSVLTECWLRECDYFLPPTKPDYLAVRGLSVLKAFRDQHNDDGFAELIGVLVNLKDGRVGSEDVWHDRLAADPANRVFQTAVPRRAYIQRAAEFDPETRTFIAKYPGDAGHSVRQVTEELLARLEGGVFTATEREEWRKPVKADRQDDNHRDVLAARALGVDGAKTAPRPAPAQAAAPQPAAAQPSATQSAAAQPKPAQAAAPQPAPARSAPVAPVSRAPAKPNPDQASKAVAPLTSQAAPAKPARPGNSGPNTSEPAKAAPLTKAVASAIEPDADGDDEPVMLLDPIAVTQAAAPDDDEPVDLGSIDQPAPLDLPASALAGQGKPTAQATPVAGRRVIQARQIVQPQIVQPKTSDAAEVATESAALTGSSAAQRQPHRPNLVQGNGAANGAENGSTNLGTTKAAASDKN